MKQKMSLRQKIDLTRDGTAEMTRWCIIIALHQGFGVGSERLRQKISTAALITLVCILLCNLLHTSASHAIIGTLMILTPGIAFTMGIRDFVQGDYLSGTIRMIDALLIAASIAIGTGLVLRLYTVFTGVVVV